MNGRTIKHLKIYFYISRKLERVDPEPYCSEADIIDCVHEIQSKLGMMWIKSFGNNLDILTLRDDVDKVVWGQS